MTYELAMASSLQPSIIGGLHVQVDDSEHTDLPTFSAQQVDIIMALCERVRNPLLGEFSMEVLVWTYHVINGKGRHKG